MKKLEAIIKCPSCGYEKKEHMPENSCMINYKCSKCNTVLKPKEGDCCVFCSYADVKCPPMQT